VYKMKIKGYDIFMWVLIIAVGFASFLANSQRVANGYFTSNTWIYLDGVFYVIFSALIVGYVVAKVLNHKRGRK
jgi:hypothetical protein